MFKHVSPVLSTLFSNACRPSQLANLGPILLTGPIGVGKRHHINTFIKELGCTATYKPFSTQKDQRVECSCDSCYLLKVRRHPDVLQLTGYESIAEFRELVPSFVNHQPLQLPYRMLILSNLHRYTKDTLDTALKVIEEPPDHLKIFATMTQLNKNEVGMIPAAMMSRFRRFYVNPFRIDQLTDIVQMTPNLSPYGKYLKSYSLPSISVAALLSYGRYDFEERFRELFVDADVLSLEDTLKRFLEMLKSDQEYSYADLLELFLEFYVTRVLQFCDLNVEANPSLSGFRPQFIRITRRWLNQFCRYLKRHNVSFYISIDSQLLTYFLTILTLRRIFEHKS